MATIDESAVMFPYTHHTLPEGKLAVASCNSDMVVIKLRAECLPKEQAQSPIIVNIENGMVHDSTNYCTFRVLEEGVKIELEVGE
jgi:hypothetical protein